MVSYRDLRGFTLVEILLVMGLTAIVLSFAALSLLGPQMQADLDSEVLKIISDMKNQQMRSMMGVTEGTSSPVSYGIKFATTTYTLFRGGVFNPADSYNFTIEFSSTIQFSTTTVSSTTLIFNRLSGEVAGYTAGQDSFTFLNTSSGATSTLMVNRYGAIIKTP